MNAATVPLPSSARAATVRAPLDRAQVDEALALAGWDGPPPRLLGTVTTTAAEIPTAEGTPTHGTAVVAESTTGAALDGHDPRRAAPGSTLWLSVVLRGTGQAQGHAGWLPLAMTLAVADAVRAAAGLPNALEWPDAIGVPGAMCGGAAGLRHLARVRVDPPDAQDESAVVVSVALNVDTDPLALPPGSTSLLLDGGRTDRAAVLASLLAAVDRRFAQWQEGDPALAADYRDRCRTIGRLAEVDGAAGWVSGIDDDGTLLVTLEASREVVRAGGDALS